MTIGKPLRVLLLCHSFNSLSQRIHGLLQSLGHEVSVELDISDTVTREAVALFSPDLVVAPFLKRLIPREVCQQCPCLVVHPGPPGDRGPSALDWALLEGQARWGVTVLRATDDYDAGPVLGSAPFDMRAAPKGSLYRDEVARAAEAALLQALRALSENSGVANTRAAPPGHWRPLMRQADRAIDWSTHTTAQVLARMNAADGQPGVLDTLFGRPCRIGDGHAASAALMQSLPTGMPGSLLARRDGAVLRRTCDGGVWIGQAALAEGPVTFKLPVAQALPVECAGLPLLQAPLQREADEWAELRYTESGPDGARVGWLAFDFYNGAMSIRQCRGLLAAIEQARQRPTQVLVLLGGTDFFSNGIHLNCIEAAAHGLGEEGAASAADASWNNINAMNDVSQALIHTTERITIAVLRGNAGAGGAFLALAADEVWARDGVLLNPHYKNMGNLYGSEYWTYLCPRRLGEHGTRELMGQRLPLPARAALAMGLIDQCMAGDAAQFMRQVKTQAQALASAYNLPERLRIKQARRASDEAAKPLAEYRKEELSRMHRNFYGFDPSYHVARYHFVNKLPHAWTPRHLALHRP